MTYHISYYALCQIKSLKTLRNIGYATNKIQCDLKRKVLIVFHPATIKIIRTYHFLLQEKKQWILLNFLGLKIHNA